MAGDLEETVSHQRHHAGFTLVELSIVLVIIGLIVGGIFVGKELIRASQLNSVLRDLDKYNSAVLTFKDKYGKLPGDISNATQFWGSAGGSGPPDDATTNCYGVGNAGAIPLGSKLTCNGNGNGMISGGIYSFDGVTDCSNNHYIYGLLCDYEQFAVWQHLANAGLDSGVYTPTRAGSASLATIRYWVRGVPGGNIPSSRFNTAEGFTLLYVCGILQNYVWPNACGHYFVYGKQFPAEVGSNNTQAFPFQPAFTPVEAKGIDTKIDDGKPGSGSVLSSRRGATSGTTGRLCSNNATAALAEYDGTLTGLECAMYFKANF